MTVALVLATEADAGMCGQLAALGVRRVDLAGAVGDMKADGMLTVAAAARTAGERVIICVGDGAVPGEVLARLLAVSTTAVYNGGTRSFAQQAQQAHQAHQPAQPGALIVDTPHLIALATAAEILARTDRLRKTDPLGALVSELA